MPRSKSPACSPSAAQWTTVTEGRVTVVVAAAQAAAPGHAPAFFNPRMQLNRDLAVCSLTAAAQLRSEADKGAGKLPMSVVDAFASSGVLGIRFAKEVAQPVLQIIINDADPLCCEIAAENAHANGLVVEELGSQQSLPCDGQHELVEGHTDALSASAPTAVPSVRVTCERAGALLHRRDFDFVHLDPFGSCVPHIDAALACAPHGGYLSLTATDTAALYGIYPAVTRRMYQAEVHKTDCVREVGVRLLLAAAARAAARHTRGIKPMMSVSSGHFLQVVVQIFKGAASADASLDEVQLAWHCSSTGVHTFTQSNPKPDRMGDGQTWQQLGPMWSGPLSEPGFVLHAAAASARADACIGAEARNLLKVLVEEASMPAFFLSVPQCQRRIKAQIMMALQSADMDTRDALRRDAHHLGVLPKLSALIALLQSSGARAARTHYESQAIRTDASYESFVALLAACKPKCS